MPKNIYLKHLLFLPTLQSLESQKIRHPIILTTIITYIKTTLMKFFPGFPPILASW